MSVTFAEIVSVMAALVAFYGIYAQNNYRRAQAGLNFTQSDSTALQDALKMKDEYRAENVVLKFDIAELKKTVEALVERDRKREAAMQDLQSRFERDALLRANVEEALAVSNQRIIELTKRVAALEDERDQLKAENTRLSNELQIAQNKQSGFGGKR